MSGYKRLVLLYDVKIENGDINEPIMSVSFGIRQLSFWHLSTLKRTHIKLNVNYTSIKKKKLNTCRLSGKKEL